VSSFPESPKSRRGEFNDFSGGKTGEEALVKDKDREKKPRKRKREVLMGALQLFFQQPGREREIKASDYGGWTQCEKIASKRSCGIARKKNNVQRGKCLLPVFDRNRRGQRKKKTFRSRRRPTERGRFCVSG